MASIEESLRTLLVNDAAVNAVVAGRVYPIRTPDNAIFPCISYQRVFTSREHRMEGAGNFTTALFAIEIWAPKIGAGNVGGAEIARDLARKVQAALDGFRGAASGVDIQGILSENEIHGYETDIEVYRTTQQWRVMFREG